MYSFDSPRVLTRIYRYWWGFHNIPRAIYYNSLSRALFQKYMCRSDTRTDGQIIRDSAKQGRRAWFWYPFKFPIFYLGVFYFKWQSIWRDDIGTIWVICKAEYPNKFLAFVVFLFCVGFYLGDKDEA
jgi:hypothetical protein